MVPYGPSSDRPAVGREPAPSSRARAAAMAAATRAGAVPPITSAAASEPSIVAAARSAAADAGLVGERPRGRIVGGRESSSSDGRRRQVGEPPDPVPLGPPDERPDDVVGDAERHATPDERVGERRRGRVAIVGRRRHRLPVDGQRRDQAGHHRERRLVGRDGAEQRRLVLLEIALVAERQALEQAEDRGHRRDRRGRPAADQLGRVRVPLVRHHRAAGRVGLGDPDEPEPRVRPPGDLLGEPAEMDHPERDGRQRLDDEVAVADGIERVRRHAVEAELRGRRLAIERVAGAGERAAARAG